MNANVTVPLLRKAVEWVEEQEALPVDKRRWNQKQWTRTKDNVPWHEVQYPNDEVESQLANNECGTVCCVAGYIGQTLDERYVGNVIVDDVHVAQFAGEALGIPSTPWPDRGHLFHSDNTAADVRRIAEELAGERL